VSVNSTVRYFVGAFSINGRVREGFMATEAMRKIYVDGHQYAYNDKGDGTSVLLAHCSGANHKQWRDLSSLLKDRYRVIAPDFLGYGESGAFRPWGPGENPDLKLLLALLTNTDRPCHLIGHSYGGFMALQAAAQMPSQVSSLTLYEPVAFNLLQPQENGPEWDEVHQLAERIQERIQASRHTSAAKVFIQHWNGALAWWYLPHKVKDRVASQMAKIAMEFADLYQPPISLDQLANLSMPVHLISGARTRKSAKSTVDILHGALPNSQLTEIPKVGHMAPITHSAIINKVILNWLNAPMARSAPTEVTNRSENPSGFNKNSLTQFVRKYKTTSF